MISTSRVFHFDVSSNPRCNKAAVCRTKKGQHKRIRIKIFIVKKRLDINTMVLVTWLPCAWRDKTTSNIKTRIHAKKGSNKHATKQLHANDKQSKKNSINIHRFGRGLSGSMVTNKKVHVLARFTDIDTTVQVLKIHTNTVFISDNIWEKQTN